jgi:hypothetical protein
MWANADDQGRLSGDPDEVKYTACPNISGISIEDIPGILIELEKQKLIRVYESTRSVAIQLLDWWETNNKLQWAWPSDYPAPDGWKDRLRYKRGRDTVVTENWDTKHSAKVSPETSAEYSPVKPLVRESNKENPTPDNRKGKGKGRIKEEEEEGNINSPENSPENSGEKVTPSPAASETKRKHTKEQLEIYNAICENIPKGFGREPDSRDLSQAADFSIELAAVGVTKKMVVDAFREAAVQNKPFLTYIRKIVISWAQSTPE